jgi:hypothetical protein
MGLRMVPPEFFAPLALCRGNVKLRVRQRMNDLWLRLV